MTVVCLFPPVGDTSGCPPPAHASTWSPFFWTVHKTEVDFVEGEMSSNSVRHGGGYLWQQADNLINCHHLAKFITCWLKSFPQMISFSLDLAAVRSNRAAKSLVNFGHGHQLLILTICYKISISVKDVFGQSSTRYFFAARRGTDSALADVSPEQELLVSSKTILMVMTLMMVFDWEAMLDETAWRLASGSKQQCDSKWNWGWWRRQQAADEEQGQREEEGEGRGRRVASCSWTVPGCFPGNKVGISTHIFRIKSQLKCSEPFDGNIFAQGSEFCPRHLKCRSCPCCHQIMFIRWE